MISRYALYDLRKREMAYESLSCIALYYLIFNVRYASPEYFAFLAFFFVMRWLIYARND